MLYSRMTEHAIAALGEIAREESTGFLSTGSVASRTSIPRPILTKVIASLAREGLVKTREGRHGGARLARPPEEISIRDVVAVFDEPELLQRCPIHGTGCSCADEAPCQLHDLWQNVRTAADRFLDEATIADVATALRR